MATDGRRIVFNAEFVDSLEPGQLEAVLAHEVMHCALGHHCRRGERDPQLWNEAADLAINPLLVANGFSLPEGALIDPGFENLSAEEIYARLLQPRRSGDQSTPANSDCSSGSGNSQQDGTQAAATGSEKRPQDPTAAQTQSEPRVNQPVRDGAFGEVTDAIDEDGRPAGEAERSRQQQEWNIAAGQAMRSAKVCGREPTNIDRPLANSRNSKQDWRSVLRDFLAARSPSDYRWSPPNRRFITSGLYLPSVARSGLGAIVIAVDTSGSISEKELEQFAGEISSICDEAQPESVHVVYCDAAVQAVQQFGPSEPIQLQPKGGGGTDFRPVFQWVEENGLEPACLIYLTDLLCHSYPNPPDYPVLWVTDSGRTAPFGETVPIAFD